MASPKTGKLGWCARALILWFLCVIAVACWFVVGTGPTLSSKTLMGHVKDLAIINEPLMGPAKVLANVKEPLGGPAKDLANIKEPLIGPAKDLANVNELQSTSVSTRAMDSVSVEGPEIISAPPHITKDFGLGRFADHIEEFLQTADRSPKTSKEVCDRQHLPSASQCPSWRWLSQYHGPEVEGRPPVFIDIGCNKGYSIASFYEHFAPASGINKKSVYLLHTQIGTIKACGVCQDCRDALKLGKNKSPSHVPEAYCIDASAFTHNQTKTVANMLKSKSPQAQGWQLFHQAMTNRTGFIKFGVCGSESCSIDRDGDNSKQTVKVPAFSFDDFVELKKIGFIDVVKLDTEGEEPLVIQGMHRSLRAHKVGFLAFELQGFGFSGWYPHFDLRRIVDLLDAYGYTCYMDTHSMKSGIALLTGCKDSRFEQPYSVKKGRIKQDGVIPQWGNLICGLRANEEIRKILAAMHM